MCCPGLVEGACLDSCRCRWCGGTGVCFYADDSGGRGNGPCPRGFTPIVDCDRGDRYASGVAIRWTVFACGVACAVVGATPRCALPFMRWAESRRMDIDELGGIEDGDL